MSGTRLVVVGDALLDRDVEGGVERLAPDAPVPVVDQRSERVRPGGAGLAAALAAADGREVLLVAALGHDRAAGELRAALARAGVDVLDLGLRGPTPEKVRVIGAGRHMLRIDRGGRDGGEVGPPGAELRAALADACGVLVSDYGRGVTSAPGVRAALAETGERRPLVWDPHPRGAPPVAGAWLATPNAAEAAGFAPAVAGEGVAAAVRRARVLARAWRARAVCVTLGADGAALAGEGAGATLLPAPVAGGGDPCGAGDRFASAAALQLADGRAPAEAARAAVAAASEFVAAGGAAPTRFCAAPASEPPERSTGEPAELHVARVRARGGTVVATGGCFDLLHAGHLALLRAARALGDCLVVCLNSDGSARRLKGPCRPLTPQAERAELLEALECVDAVAVFEEDTPAELLGRLRPDVWVKGGDYDAADLPEAELVRGYGGRVAIVPYVAGRSTTRLVEAGAARAR